MRVSEFDAARIACRALVSPSSVRRALTGATTVTAYTRTRVFEACRELNFPIPAAVADAEVFERDTEAPRAPENDPNR